MSSFSPARPTVPGGDCAEEGGRPLPHPGGEDKLYSGGLSLRTTLDPNLQKIARQVLIDGLVDFDRQKGWRGPASG